MKYRTRPVEVEALPFTDVDSYLRIVEWINGALSSRVSVGPWVGYATPTMLIMTPAGTLRAQPGDWIVRDALGDFWVMNSSEFALLYEPVA